MGDVHDPDFRNELSVADIRIGPNSHMRIYGFADIEPRLVEVHCGALFYGPLHLTVEQAEAISSGLAKAAAKARANG
jgi:hypothetical protein